MVDEEDKDFDFKILLGENVRLRVLRNERFR